MSWLISKALMNSLYSPEQVAEYLGENFSDGEQSAPLNGSPIQQAYCAPDKMTDFSRLSRFGMTFKPLTESRGEELLTLFRAGFHAKTLAQQEKAQELTENDQECGSTWRGWLAKYDPDTSLWRTAQCSLLEDLNESLATLPRSGMTRNGLLWELPMLEQTISETGSGLSQQIWPTPAARDGKPTNTLEALTDGRFVDQLANRVKMVQNNIWTTPCSRDWKGHTITTNHPDGFNKSLANDVLKFPTPQASDCRDRGNMSNPAIQRRAENGKQLNLSMVVHPTSGQLNPTWVEWLMGWPLGWTDLKPLAMGKFPCVRLPHGESSQEICDGNN
jgi:hypothetical protein